MLINILHLAAHQVIALGQKAIDEQKSRQQSYLEQMAIQRTKFRVWDGIVAKPVHTGISRGHKQIVRDAKERGLKSVCIMEDDCIFSHKDSFKYFLSQIPKDFDLFFGLIYSPPELEGNRVSVPFSGGMTLYVVHERFYDVFLMMDEKFHIDRILGGLGNKYKYYVCDPMVVTQKGGYSFNHKRDLRYEGYINGKELFNGLNRK